MLASRGQKAPHKGFCWDDACKIPRSGFGIVAKSDYHHHIPRSGLRKMNILSCCCLCPTGNNVCAMLWFYNTFCPTGKRYLSHELSALF